MNKRVKKDCRHVFLVKKIISIMLSKLFSIQYLINIFEYCHVSSTVLFTGDITVNKIDKVAAITGPSFCCRNRH